MPVFFDIDPFGNREIEIPPVTDQEYEENKRLAEELLNDYSSRVKKALGSRQARQLRKEAQNYASRETMDQIGNGNWNDVYPLILRIFCLHLLYAQCRFSRKEYRKTLTPESVKSKCEILGFDKDMTAEASKYCGF